MITRRTFLKSSLATAAVLRLAPGALAKAAQPRTRLDFDMPDDACDCHVHIFGDPQQFPFFAGRTYTPGSASVDELRAMHQRLHLDRTVVVQPSIYGTDNSCMLDAVRQLGENGRGVAVIDAQTPESALDDMDRAGIRGIRLNLVQGRITDPALARQKFQAAAERLRNRKWHIQIYCRPTLIETIHDQVMASPVPVVFDHFGGALAADGVQQPGFGALLSLVRAGNAYVKISGAADLISTQAPAYADVAPLAAALLSANRERILWASNWPHPDTAKPPTRPAAEITPLLPTDDGQILNLLAKWVPDSALRTMILVDNPARLYGF